MGSDIVDRVFVRRCVGPGPCVPTRSAWTVFTAFHIPAALGTSRTVPCSFCSPRTGTKTFAWRRIIPNASLRSVRNWL